MCGIHIVKLSKHLKIHQMSAVLKKLKNSILLL